MSLNKFKAFSLLETLRLLLTSIVSQQEISSARLSFKSSASTFLSSMLGTVSGDFECDLEDTFDDEDKHVDGLEERDEMLFSDVSIISFITGLLS